MTAGYLRHHGPLALAHRGFSLDGGENAMAAFDAAVDLGMGWVETDVHATADGVAVAFHDARLDRVTDRAGAVNDLPWAEVSKARIAGRYPIPRLAEVLAGHPHVRVNLDLKSDEAVGPTVAVIEEAKAHDRVLVTSFSDRRRRRALAGLSRPVATSAGQKLTAEFWTASRGIRVGSAMHQLAAGGGFRAISLPARGVGRWTTAGARRIARRLASGIDAFQVPETYRGIRVLDAPFLAAAHDVGAQVHVWTVDDPADMHRLLDLGVDGLISDRSDLLREVLITRGQW